MTVDEQNAKCDRDFGEAKIFCLSIQRSGTASVGTSSKEHIPEDRKRIICRTFVPTQRRCFSVRLVNRLANILAASASGFVDPVKSIILTPRIMFGNTVPAVGTRE